MSYHNKTSLKQSQQGFTIPELLIVIILIGALSGLVYTSFNGIINSFFGLQREGLSFTQLASKSERVAKVIRGTTDIVSATKDDLVLYAYFSPADTYVSKVHYYKNATNTKLFADVTRMTANPPVGTPITSTLTTYTLMDPYYEASSSKLFSYLDASGTEIATPISDLHTIKGVKVTLAVPANQKNTAQTLSLTLSLRNRKTNL